MTRLTFRHGKTWLPMLAAGVLWLLPAQSWAAAPESKPNVVFILADDLGWTDLACYGSGYYRTPNIDRMAREGIKFTTGYTCGPNCQPTRAALMSGQYGPRTGIYTVGSTDRFDTTARPLVPYPNTQNLAPEVTTFAEALKAAGYTTGLFGKWHLGQDEAHHPLAQGFDESIVSMGKHFDFATNPKVDTPEGIYLADFLTDKAVDFISRHKDEPFLLCLHHFAVHSPWDAKQDLIDSFKERPPAGGHDNPTYAAMIASVDESVGRVRDKLAELGLDDNTLVIFTSDNGGVGGYEAAGLVNAGSITDNAPLRSGKGSLYEGGVRVPYLFAWKGTIAPGSTTDVAINSVDLYPTLLELAGASAPDPAKQPLDGTSYLALLKNPSATTERKPLFWHFPGYLGAGRNEWRTTPVSTIHEGDWKLLEFLEDNHIELYNLADDLGERNNLAATHPEKARQLHAQLIEWRQAIQAPMPEARVAGERPATPKKKGAGKAARKKAGLP